MALDERPFSLALLGATGAVGRAVLEVLEDADVPVSELRLLASERSAGEALDFQGDALPVRTVAEGAFRGCDVAILAAGEEAARTWAPRARAEGCLVVDGSAAFRSDPEVPLIAAAVNHEALDGAARGLVASPDPLALALAAVARPLEAAAGLARVVAVALEAASGAGRAGESALERQAADLMNGREPEGSAPFPHRLAYNLLPLVGPAGADGIAVHEARLAGELRRLLGLPGLAVGATAVQVPVFHGHAAAVHLALRRPLSPEAAREALRAAPGVKVLDQPSEGVYPMPQLALNDDAVLVGRLRADAALEHGLALFLALDNLRAGGATNLVRLARLLARRRPVA